MILLAQQDQSSNLGNKATGAIKSGARKAGNAVKNKIKKKLQLRKKIQKQIVRLIKAAIRALVRTILMITGPIGLLILVIVIVATLAVGGILNITGSNGYVIEDTDLTNPMVEDENHVYQAQALLEPQALKDAYYKYMACRSYIKIYDDGSDEGMTLELDYDDDEMVEDFAGLSDYMEREDNFYLSSEFLLYADRRLNDDKFYYPEQLIQSVYWEYDDDRNVEAQQLTDDDNNLVAESYAYERSETVAEDNMKYEKQSETEKTPGVWDYGFGSVLQYEPATIDKVLDYEITTIMVENAYLDGDNVGYEIIEVPIDGTYNVAVWVSDPPPEEGDGGDGADALAEDGDAGGHWELESRDAIDLIDVPVSDNFHMDLEGEDVTIGQRAFNDSTLNSAFGNGGVTTYPIKVPVLKSVASLSGNIKYHYMSEEDSQIVEGLEIGTSGNYRDPMNKIVYGISSTGEELYYTRVGTVTSTQPMLESEESDPWGFDYIHDYTNNYVTYVPNTIKADLTFEERVSEELTTFLKRLGLLVPYGANASGEYNAFAPCGLTADELDTIIDTYLGDYAGNSLRGCGQDLLDMEEEYGVNALFCLAVATQEQSMGKSNSVHVNNNNFFSFVGSGDAGSWTSSTGRKWAVFSSPAASIDRFGWQISQEDGYYYGKTIYGIGQTYCPNSEVAGQANDWARGVMNSMNMFMGYLGESMSVDPDTEYEAEATSDSIYIEGFEPGDDLGGESGSASSGNDYDVGGNPEYPLYKIRAFDVRTATGLLQKSIDPNQSLWDSVVNFVGDVVDSFLDKIGEAFSSAFGIDTTDPLGYNFYHYTMSTENSELMVCESLAASSNMLLEDVMNQLEGQDKNAIFLFLGKNGGFGDSSLHFGSTLIPSILVSIEGMTSPTDNYYSVTDAYDPTTGFTGYAIPEGTPVKSPLAASVTAVSDTVDGYTQLTLEGTLGGKRYTITFGGLTGCSLSVGDSVSQEQIVGYAGADGVTIRIQEDGENLKAEDVFYQPTLSGGAGFVNLLNPDGSFNESAIKALNQAFISANRFYPSGSSTPLSSYTGGSLHCSAYTGSYGGGWSNGLPSQFDKWHDWSAGINVLQPWQCTWWANGRASEFLETYGTKYKKYPTQSGNGGDYYSYNVSGGWFNYGSTPKPYSLISWSSGSYGHVAFVEAVEDNGSAHPDILISEAGSGTYFGGVRRLSYPYSYGSGYTLNGFVYLDEPR